MSASTPERLAPEWLRLPADGNALDPAIWPQRTDRTAAGVLSLAGVDAAELVSTYGSPLLVLDEREVRDRAEAAVAAFSNAATSHGTTAAVYYAGKAFLSIEVARWVSQSGMNVDVCTGGELAVALAAGVEPARIGFHGNNKSLAELELAVQHGVGSVIIDSFVEIERLGEIAQQHGVTQRVYLRVNSGVHAETHDFLATAHEDQKFGFAMDIAPDAVARIRANAGLEFAGLHCHIGSQIFGASGFRESAKRLLALHEALLKDGPVPSLNLGGGYGIAYTEADAATPLPELAEAIVAEVAAACAERSLELPALSFEPGRSIVGPAGVTLYTVGTTKDVHVQAETESGVRRYLSVDGGMSDNARPALYGAQYTARLASRTTQAPGALSRVVGKHCESGDIVVEYVYLPADVDPGDLLAVPATGAYCYPLSSNYNHVPRPAVIAVRDGAHRVIVRAETMEDLLARDLG